MNAIDILKEHLVEIKMRFGVKRIGLFGSSLRGELKATSDIDLIVEFEEPTFNNFINLVFFLEELFGRKVGILTPEGLKSIRIKEVAEEIKRSTIYV